VITRIAQRREPRRPAFVFLAAAVVASLLVSAVALAALVVDSGSFSVIVPNKETSSPVVDIGDASVEYIGSSASNQSSGTGIFDPFVRLQGAPTQEGYNTNGAVEFQTKAGQWTKAILASAIPIVDCDGLGSGTATCWELFVDINESNTAKHVSLNEVEIWFTTNQNLVGYPQNFTAPDTKQVYDFSGEILIHDVNQGSGRGDLRFLVELANIDAWTSTTYFVLYSEWGTSTGTPAPGKNFQSEGGFEEWKVRKTANVSILKTANPAGPVDAGDDIGFDITVSNTGVAAASNVTFTDNLPAGGGLDWSLDPAFTGCSITGSVGTEVLSCTFASIAAGGSVGPIHITSATTADDCGVISNTAIITAGGAGSSTATVTVQCGALQITKTAKHFDTESSPNLAATFTVVDADGVSHEITTDGTTGIGCANGVAIGETTSITETGVPTGYSAPTIANVTVASATCADAGVTNVNVENTPLTDVDISIDSLHDGATSTLIECWGPGSDPATDDPDYTTTVSDGSLSIDDLEPTDPAITLNCQITIDP
jgi:uncharacterized repeat protein (TIGR01451 family)